MSNFQKASSWNDIAGNKSPSVPTFPPKETVDKCIGLLQEEVDELREAIIYKGLKDVAKEASDVLFVTYGLCHAFGIDVDRVFHGVHMSNMTKFCAVYSDAEATVEHYKKKGTECYIEEVDGIFVVKRKSDNKVVKGVRYKPYSMKGVF